MKRIMAILGLVVALGGAAGVVASLDSRYAKADRLHAVEDDVRRHKIEVRMEKIQERLWAMEDVWAKRFKDQYDRIHDNLAELLHFMTEEAREQFRELQAEYEKLEEELKRMDTE